ncbi:AAA family ATPase [Occultella aeris]|uniref:ATP-dependent zinc metalloprotease FtsH 3 n=1 Tax=Occultella aeris TaxID=2761496 RepID=A0A7M4DF33_9MICO|nr:AAA family ATPase [Occultella aeris]VZO35526.1 ATP-dependent zinc metalloprotease FtsH 3 [Occultella aeris]
MTIPPADSSPLKGSLASFLADFHALANLAAEHSTPETSGAPLLPVLTAHLGVDPRTPATLTEEISPLRTADADVALEHVITAHGGGEQLGIGGGDQRWHNSLSEIVQYAGQHGMFPIGPVEFRTVPVGPANERSVVAFGLHLFAFDGSPVAVLQRGSNPQFGAAAKLEVLTPDREVAAAFLTQIRAAMNSHSVLRGQVVTFTSSEYGPSAGGVTFHARPEVGAGDIVLPEGTLHRIERHVLGIGAHAEALARAGQHLKRGVLLYGPPGTGKTLTVRYLVGAASDATVILLSGQTLALVSLAAETARTLAPAIVVLEDCDLVAGARNPHTSSPLLFEVLDALDGLAADSDVTFLLTTNRVDVLEPALAQRPGRVDLAVEIPLPDAPARRALLDLYAGDLPFSAQAREEVAEAASGATASFVKELVRRAVLLAAEAGTPERVGDDELRSAVAEMMSDGDAITRATLGASGPDGAPGGFDEDGSDDGTGEGGVGWFAYAPLAGEVYRPGLQGPHPSASFSSDLHFEPDAGGGTEAVLDPGSGRRPDGGPDSGPDAGPDGGGAPA